MPAVKSAKKRVRTSETARRRNAATRTRVSSARRKTFQALYSKNADESSDKFREYCSVLDKAVKKGVIKRNTSIRRKNRAGSKLALLQGAVAKKPQNPDVKE